MSIYVYIYTYTYTYCYYYTYSVIIASHLRLFCHQESNLQIEKGLIL